MMRDYKQEIDDINNPLALRQLLDVLALEIEQLEDSPYEDDKLFERIHDLELILRYGELKVEKLLA
jgi:hypothetical protein